MENSFFKLRLLFQNGKFPFQNWKLSLKMENSLENCQHGKLWNPLPSFRHGNAGFKFLLSTEPRNGLGWKGPLGSPGFFLGIFWKLWFFFFPAFGSSGSNLQPGKWNLDLLIIFGKSCGSPFPKQLFPLISHPCPIQFPSLSLFLFFLFFFSFAVLISPLAAKPKLQEEINPRFSHSPSRKLHKDSPISSLRAAL